MPKNTGFCRLRQSREERIQTQETQGTFREEHESLNTTDPVLKAKRKLGRTPDNGQRGMAAERGSAARALTFPRRGNMAGLGGWVLSRLCTNNHQFCTAAVIYIYWMRHQHGCSYLTFF